MKKQCLFVVSFIFCFAVSYGQSIIQRATSSSTAQDARLYAQLNLGIPRFSDTSSANLSKGLDSSGTVIYTYNPPSIWYRSHHPSKHWVSVLDVKNFKGGLRPVSSIADRDGIPINFRYAGMVVTDTVDNIAYQLIGGVQNSNWVQIQLTNPLPFASAGQILYNSNGLKAYVGENLFKVGNYVYTDAQLNRAKGVTPTSFSEIYNNFSRFSHGSFAQVPGDSIPALPLETNSWSYNSGTNTIHSTTNSRSYIGFTSNSTNSYYTIAATLTADDLASGADNGEDNDKIGIVAASAKDYSKMVANHAFGLDPDDFSWDINTTDSLVPDENDVSLIISRDDLTLQHSVWYNHGKTTQFLISNGTSLLDYTTTNNWNGATIDVKVVKNAGQIKFYTSNFSDAPGGKGSLGNEIIVDLLSDPRLVQFAGATSYGYSAQSQANASFTNVTTNVSDDAIYDLRNGNVWVPDSDGDYVVDSTAFFDRTGRGFHNRNENSWAYLDENDSLRIIADSSLFLSKQSQIIISASDYLVGDSATDNTAAMRAMFAMASANGAWVHFPKGNYLISDTVNIPYACKITGIGGLSPHNNLVPGSYLSGSSNIIQTTSKSALIVNHDGVSISGLTIKNTVATPTAGAGILVRKGNSFRLNDTYIGYFYNNLYFETGIDMVVDRNQFTNPQNYNVYLSGIIGDEGDNTFYGNMFNGSISATATHFKGEYVGGLRLNNNKFHIAAGQNGVGNAFPLTAIDINSQSSTGDVLILGNSIEAYSETAIKIRVKDASTVLSKILINSNQISNAASGATGHDIDIEAPSIAKIYGVNIQGNYISNFGTKPSIYMKNVSQASLVGNLFPNNIYSYPYKTDSLVNCTNVNTKVVGTISTESGVVGGHLATSVLNLQSTMGNGTLTSAGVKINVGNDGATNAVTVLNNGKTGVGTTDPSEVFHVSTGGAALALTETLLSNANYNTFKMGFTGQNRFSLGLTSVTGAKPFNFINWDTLGNFNIIKRLDVGTAVNVNSKMVINPDTAGSKLALTFVNSAAGTGNKTGVGFGSTGNYGFIDYDPQSAAGIRYSALGPHIFGANTNAAYPSATFTEGMRLNAGKLGIGDTLLASKLNVAGDIKIVGTNNGIMIGNSTDVATQFNFDAPNVSTATTTFRFFRSTSTSGARTVTILKGDGTNSTQHSFNSFGDSYINALAGKLGIGTATPDASAAVDIPSTTRGFLMPRMNRTQWDAIASKATGLQAIGTTLNKIIYYDGSATRAIDDSATIAGVYLKKVGTATNDAASAGNIGEEINSYVSTYTNYTTTATYQNIASITLTAGDWDLSAFFTYSSNGATITAANDAIFLIGTATASATGATEGKNIAYVPQAALLGTSHFSDAIPSHRVSISGTTTYYLNSQATFTIGNPQFVGGIRARRCR